MKMKSSSLVIAAAALAFLASGCGPDLAITRASANLDNVQQSASFVIVNNGAKTTSPFEMEILLLDDAGAVVAVAYQKSINGLGYGEKVELKNISLRHLPSPDNDCLGIVTQAVFSIDPQDVIRELDESNNRRVVKVQQISAVCDEIVRFEALPVGKEFIPISHIASDGISFAIRALPERKGFAMARNDLALGNGQAMWLKNAWLEPRICLPRHYIAFDAGYYGGEIFLEVNGDMGGSPYPNLAAIDGAIIGGVAVEVSGDGDNPGVWQFNGVVNSLKIGGQELAIDNILFWTQQKRML